MVVFSVKRGAVGSANKEQSFAKLWVFLSSWSVVVNWFKKIEIPWLPPGSLPPRPLAASWLALGTRSTCNSCQRRRPSTRRNPGACSSGRVSSGGIKTAPTFPVLFISLI